MPKLRDRFSLRTLGGKFTVALLAFSLIPAGSIVISMFALDNTTDQIGSLVVDKAADLIEKIERNLYEGYGDVQAFALNSVILDRLNWYQKDDESNAIVHTMDAYMSTNGIYLLTMLVDLDGRVIAVNSRDASGKPLDSGWIYAENFARAKWFQDVRAGRFLEDSDQSVTGTVVEEVRLNTHANRVYGRDDLLALTYSAPVLGEDGRAIAVWHNVADFSLVEEMVVYT